MGTRLTPHIKWHHTISHDITWHPIICASVTSLFELSSTTRLLTSLVPRLSPRFWGENLGTRLEAGDGNKAHTSHDITWSHMTSHGLTWHHMICASVISSFELSSTTHLLQPSTSTQFSSCLHWALNSWQCWNWTPPLGSGPTLYRVTGTLWWVCSTPGASTSLSLPARGRWVLELLEGL